MERKKNIFDQIGSIIPGYRGYQERDGRRNCDKQLRNEVCLILNESEIKLNEIMIELVKSKKTEELINVESYRKKINTLTSKINYLPYGESSFFSDTQVKENELKTIYEFDLELLESSIEIQNCIMENKLNKIKISIENLVEQITKRSNYLLNIR